MPDATAPSKYSLVLAVIAGVAIGAATTGAIAVAASHYWTLLVLPFDAFLCLFGAVAAGTAIGRIAPARPGLAVVLTCVGLLASAFFLLPALGMGRLNATLTGSFLPFVLVGLLAWVVSCWQSEDRGWAWPVALAVILVLVTAGYAASERNSRRSDKDYFVAQAIRTARSAGITLPTGTRWQVSKAGGDMYVEVHRVLGAGTVDVMAVGDYYVENEGRPHAISFSGRSRLNRVANEADARKAVAECGFLKGQRIFQPGFRLERVRDRWEARTKCPKGILSVPVYTDDFVPRSDWTDDAVLTVWPDGRVKLAAGFYRNGRTQDPEGRY